MCVLKAEHPNPQFARENWVNLNGEWDFGFEKAKNAFVFQPTKAVQWKFMRKTAIRIKSICLSA